MDVSANAAAEHLDLTAELEFDRRPPRTDLHDADQRHRVEGALTTIPGILAARLVAGYERDVDELHVVTTLQQTPKHTVRDVQTVLMAKFGVTTDHRVISVVQLDADAVVEPPGTMRLAIERVGLANVGVRVTAEVELRAGDVVHRSEEGAAATANGRNRAVALATLGAVRSALGDIDVAIELDGVDLVDVGGVTTAVTVLTQRSGRGEEILSGTAVVREVASDAVARAVLDATNRLLARALA